MPIPKPKKGEKKQDFLQRCMSDSTMVNEYDQKQRFAICSSAWDSKSNEGEPKVCEKHIDIRLNGSAEGHRLETLEGKEYEVYPATILVEGVLQASNAEVPELALYDEFASTEPLWNGRPVTLGHPKINGVPVSANAPELWEKYRIGFLYNTKADVEKRALTSEAWIEISKVDSVEGASEVMEVLRDGGEVEVSTGLFALTEQAKGTFKGEEYYGIWRDIKPDHLAVLPLGVKGACSLEDGCGISKAMEDGMVDGDDDDKLNSCGMGSKKKKDKKSKAMGDEDVKDNQDTGGYDCSCKDNGRPKSLSAALLEAGALKGLESIKSSLNAVDQALRQLYNGDFGGVLDVQDGFVVYDLWVDSVGWQLFRSSFSTQDDGTVTVSSEKESVRAVTNYVPLKMEVNQMTKANGDQESKKLDSIDAVFEACEEHVAAQLKEGLEFARQLRENLIAELKDNEFCPFEEAELKDLPTTKLQALQAKFNEAKLKVQEALESKKPTGPNVAPVPEDPAQIVANQQGAQDDDLPPPPPRLFEVKK